MTRSEIQLILRMLLLVVLVLFVAGLTWFFGMRGWAEAQSRPHRLIQDTIAVLAVDGSRQIGLEQIAGEPLDRVCVLYNAFSETVASAAAGFGLEPMAPRGSSADVEMPDRSYAVFLVGRTGEVLYGTLGGAVFDGPRGRVCAPADGLAIAFDDVDPLSGGRIIRVSDTATPPAWRPQ